MLASGNTKLVEYGIQTEDSDVRIHVSVIGRCIYVYKTLKGLLAIGHKVYAKVPVKTRGIVTAQGYLVPPSDIEGCLEIDIPEDVFLDSGIEDLPQKGAQGEKGAAAVTIVKNMFMCGLIPLTLEITEVDDKAMQIKGTDLTVKANVKIQIKCDYRAGGKRGCSGNLFIQVAECNPFHIH